MARPFPASLSVRMVFLVLLALLPGLGLTFYEADAQRSHEAGRVREQALLLARVASANQEQLIVETRALLAGLVQDPLIRSQDLTACHALLADLLKRHPGYSNFGMSAPNGDVVCNARPLPGRINNADRSYFRGAMRTKGFAIGEFQIGRVTGKPAINFGYPVLGAGGEVRAVVFAARDLTWMNRLAGLAALPVGAGLTLVDGHGTVLARHPNPDQWVGRPATPLGITVPMRAQGTGLAEARGTDGARRLFGFTKVGGVGGSGDVLLVVDIPTAVAYVDVNSRFAHILAVLGLVGLLAFVIVWLAASTYILRPVTAVVTAAKRLAAGDLGARTGMDADRGELGELMKSFDEMAGALQQQTSQLQRQLRRLAALRTIDSAIATTPDLPMILDVLLDQVTSQLAVDAADVLLLNPHVPRLDFAGGRGFVTPALQHTHLQLGEGFAGQAARERRFVCIPDLAKEAGPPVYSHRGRKTLRPWRRPGVPAPAGGNRGGCRGGDWERVTGDRPIRS